MKLYHGTNMEFNEIKLSLYLPYKDFGQGFYLTDIEDQAKRMAERKSRRQGRPIVQEYEIDELILAGQGDCNARYFKSQV